MEASIDTNELPMTSEGESEAQQQQQEYKKEDDEETCSICLEKLTNPVQLPCKHQFCSSCLHQWRNKYFISQQQQEEGEEDGRNPKKTCPECRQSIPPTRQMIMQLKLLKEKLATLKKRLASTKPFTLQEIIQRGEGYSKMIGHEMMETVADSEVEYHDSMLREILEVVATDFQKHIEGAEANIMGDVGGDDLVIDDTSEFDAIPSEIYDAAGFEFDDLPKVLQWLGPPPIPPKRINARNPNHMDNTLLHLAAKRNGIGLMGFLLQNGADVNSEMCAGATPIETIAWRKTYDAESRLLLEWGAKKESEIVPGFLEHITLENKELAHLLTTPLGGRRCEIVGLSKRADLNNKCCIAGKYLKGKDRYEILVEGSGEQVCIRSVNLKRRDRTPNDSGVVFQYDSNTDSFSKTFVASCKT